MADTKAGGISIDVKADFAQFTSGIEKVNQSIKTFGDQSKAHFENFSRVTDLAKNALGSLGVAMSIGAFLGFIKNVVETTTQLGNLADQVGINVESLQELAQVGQDFGLSTDQISGGLEKLNRSIGEAATGNAAAEKTFDDLGIAIRDQQNNVRSGEEVLRDFADVMATIPDIATRAAYENDVLGRGASKLDPIFRQGGAAMRAAMEDAKAMGTVIGEDDVEALREMSRASDDAMDRVTTNTAHMIAGMKDFWQSILDAGKALFDLGQQTDTEKWFASYKKVVDLTKEEAKLVEQIASAGQQGGMPGTFWPSELPDLQKRLEAVRTELANIRAESARQTPHLVPPTIPRTLIEPPVGTTATATGSGSAAHVTTDAEKQAAAIAKVVEQLQFENEQIGMSSEAQKLNTALRQAGVEITTVEGQRIAAEVHAGAERTKQLEDENKLDQEAKTLKESLLTPQQKYNDLLREYDELLRTGRISQEEHNKGVANAAKAVEEASPAYQAAIDEQKEFKSAIEDAAGSLVTDLGRAFTDSGSAADRWKNFLNHAIQDVMSAFDSLIKKLVGSGVESLLGDLGGATLGSIFGGGSGAVLGPLAGSPMLLASGGHMGIGDWAVVGEAGPELVYADTPGNVMSAERTRGVFGGGGDGGGNVAYIDARGADAAAVARLEAALSVMNYSFEHRAIAAVSNERKRGGVFAATFRR
jgi:Phage-related minor tail protein